MVKRSGRNRLRFTDHALDRMVERDITIGDVEAVLQHGQQSPGKDDEIHFSIDLSNFVWSPGAPSLPITLFGMVVVTSYDGACITVFRKGDHYAS